MIITPGQAVLDLPADEVHHLIIVHERRRQKAAQGQGGPVVTVIEGVGTIKRSTSMMRVDPRDMDAAVATAGPHLFAMPSFWCPTEDGKVRVHPRPDKDYEVEPIGRNGKPLGYHRSVAPDPIETYVAAITKSGAAAREPGPQIQRFTLASDDVA